MTFTKLFDIHYECGINASDFYAKTYIDGNKIQAFSNISLCTCLVDVTKTLYSNNSIATLKSKPSQSAFPFVGVDPGEIPLYYLHVECGKDSSVNLVYARTELKEKGVYVEYISKGAIYLTTINNLIFDLEQLNILNNLKYKANTSVFPFSSPSVPDPDQIKLEFDFGLPKKDEDVKRQLPSQIIDISHPGCQSVCTSFDHFKTSKCNSICEWRKI